MHHHTLSNLTPVEMIIGFAALFLVLYIYFFAHHHGHQEKQPSQRLLSSFLMSSSALPFFVGFLPSFSPPSSLRRWWSSITLRHRSKRAILAPHRGAPCPSQC